MNNVSDKFVGDVEPSHRMSGVTLGLASVLIAAVALTAKPSDPDRDTVKTLTVIRADTREACRQVILGQGIHNPSCLPDARSMCASDSFRACMATEGVAPTDATQAVASCYYVFNTAQRPLDQQTMISCY